MVFLASPICKVGGNLSKKYYWLKLKNDFFEDDTIQYIEEQENGILYVNFYLKLCLKSLKTDGKLIRTVGDTLIPYDVKALAKLTNVSCDTVAVAMQLFEAIGLIKKLETGEIYLSQINELIGKETSKAELMRIKRAREKMIGNNVTNLLPECSELLPECSETVTQSIEIDIRDRDKEIDKDNIPSSSPQRKNDKKIGDGPSPPKPSKESKKKKVYPAIEEQIANFTDEEELQIALAGFVDARKKMKKPLTDYAFYCNLLDLKRLEEKGYNKLECVRFAVSKGWQGFYAPYEGAKKGGQAARANKPVAIAGNKTDYSLIYRKQVGMNG